MPVDIKMLRVGDFIACKGAIYEVQIAKFDGNKIFCKTIDPLTGAHVYDANVLPVDCSMASKEQILTVLSNRMKELNAQASSLSNKMKILSKRMENYDKGIDHNQEIIKAVQSAIDSGLNANEKLKKVAQQLGSNVTLRFSNS